MGLQATWTKHVRQVTRGCRKAISLDRLGSAKDRDGRWLLYVSNAFPKPEAAQCDPQNTYFFEPHHPLTFRLGFRGIYDTAHQRVTFTKRIK